MSDRRDARGPARTPPWTALYLGFVAALLLSPGLVHWQPGREFGPREVHDLVLNGLLFVPLGFCFRRWRWWALPILATLISATAEWLQHWLPRQPDLLDVIANVTGALFGRWLAPRLRWPHPRLPRWVPLLLWIAALVALSLESTRIRENDFRLWEDSFALVIGNEALGERPWKGEISSLALWDRALPGESLRARSRAAAHPPTFRFDVLDDLRWSTSWQMPWDGEWQRQLLQGDILPGPAFEIRDGALQVRGGRWLLGTLLLHAGDDEQTPETTWSAGLAHALRESAGLSIKISLGITDLDLADPARILTFSADPYRRNFTVGQRERNLVLRVATPTTGPNGTAPAIETCDDPLTLGRHQIAMSFDRHRGRIFVDGRCHCDYLLGIVRTGPLLGRGIAATLFALSALAALALGGLPADAPFSRRAALATAGVAISVAALAAADAWRHFPDYAWVVATTAIVATITTLPLLRGAGSTVPEARLEPGP